MNASSLISELGLQRHPEGGWYRQTYSSGDMVQTRRGTRHASTAILYLLKDDDVSALHRIASDEVWHFYVGSAVKIEFINAEELVTSYVLGNDIAAGELLQAWVPSGQWFGASLVCRGWALVGCTVAPGFDFADFEIGRQEQLLGKFPHCEAMIRRLSRE